MRCEIKVRNPSRDQGRMQSSLSLYVEWVMRSVNSEAVHERGGTEWKTKNHGNEGKKVVEIKVMSEQPSKDQGRIQSTYFHNECFFVMHSINQRGKGERQDADQKPSEGTCDLAREPTERNTASLLSLKLSLDNAVCPQQQPKKRQIGNCA